MLHFLEVQGVYMDIAYSGHTELVPILIGGEWAINLERNSLIYLQSWKVVTQAVLDSVCSQIFKRVSVVGDYFMKNVTFSSGKMNELRSQTWEVSRQSPQRRNKPGLAVVCKTGIYDWPEHKDLIHYSREPESWAQMASVWQVQTILLWQGFSDFSGIRATWRICYSLDCKPHCKVF